MIAAAKRHYSDFLVPTNAVSAVKVPRYYTSDQQTDLDIKTSENLIGDIINLGQDLNSMIWDALNHGATIEEVMPIYLDASQLDVMSNVEIDRAKKEFAFSNSVELRKLRKKYERLSEDGKKIKPHFFKFLSNQKGYPQTNTKSYQKHDTTMDYLHSVVNSYSSKGISTPAPTMRFSDVLDAGRYDRRKASERQVSRIIGLVEEFDSKVKYIYSMSGADVSPAQKAALVEEERQKCSDYIGNIKLDYHTAIRLLRLIEYEKYKHIRRRVFHVLFSYPNSSFFDLIQQSKEKLPEISRSKRGELDFYGIKFTKKV